MSRTRPDGLQATTRRASILFTTSAALATALLAFVTAHLALVVGLARQGSRRDGRTGLRRFAMCGVALVVLPLAPWWGYRAGMRRWSIAWGAALLLYALGTIVAAAR
jgi:hypothetical protein